MIQLISTETIFSLLSDAASSVLASSPCSALVTLPPNLCCNQHAHFFNVNDVKLVSLYQIYVTKEVGR